MLKHQETWVTEDGRHIKVCDLSEEHMRNILSMLIRKHHLDPYEEMAEFMHDQDIFNRG